MSFNFYKWLQEQDDIIKKGVLFICDSLFVDCNFKGYYIEDNNLIGNVLAPQYETLKQYKELNPYTNTEHIRYFFELTKAGIKHVATVLSYERSKDTMQVCLEEQYEYITIENGVVEMTNFEPLTVLIKEKFKL
ncbi:hypothetical protein SAMN02927921_04127 [Sinomicrobium oceani]|uniref:Uncharacterized protein n=1 Tax=Sinomicrobium oceani TaxID=1150368 RepID=A0A1K1RX39_9FLAO|nr:hypothetical protein [Sinomicrobium oceani]SFW76522.1 hypothetical protein SAMN02927921_04127 [Sinomicrobium oceani]